MPPVVDGPGGVNAVGTCVLACELEERALNPWLALAWFSLPAWLCAPSEACLLPTDLLPPVREPLGAPKRAPDAGWPPAGEREARMPADRALPGKLAIAGPWTPDPGIDAGTELLAAGLCVGAVFDPLPLSRQIPPG